MIQYTRFSHCPRCASASISVFRKNGIKCADCGYIIFHNMAAAVACIVEVGDTIALMRRAREPQRGALVVPGGFVDYHESLEEALSRETREELSIDLVDLRYIGSFPNTYEYENVTYFTSDAFFTGRPRDPSTMRVSEEHTEFLLVRPAEIDLETIAFQSMRTMIDRYRTSLMNGTSPKRTQLPG